MRELFNKKLKIKKNLIINYYHFFHLIQIKNE